MICMYVCMYIFSPLNYFVLFKHVTFTEYK